VPGLWPRGCRTRSSRPAVRHGSDGRSAHLGELPQARSWRVARPAPSCAGRAPASRHQSRRDCEEPDLLPQPLGAPWRVVVRCCRRGPLGCSQLNLSHRGTSDLVVIETTLASHRRIQDQATPSVESRTTLRYLACSFTLASGQPGGCASASASTAGAIVTLRRNPPGHISLWGGKDGPSP
jgi:hypothetical protein